MKTLISRPLISQQAGVSLIESLIALLIFSMGIIALMGLQAVSIKNSIDAKYRADAAYLANQIISTMWVDRSNIDSYAHYATGTTPCSPTGNASTYANVTNWIGSTSTAGTLLGTLPNATADKQQIVVTTPLTNVKQVTVTVCWKGPQESGYHNFVATAQINI